MTATQCQSLGFVCFVTVCIRLNYSTNLKELGKESCTYYILVWGVFTLCISARLLLVFIMILGYAT